MKICKQCGQNFGGINKVFCSKRCSSLNRALSNHSEGKVNTKRLPERVCQWCGKEYPRKIGNPKFCSRKCYGDSKKGVSTGAHKPETIAKIRDDLRSRSTSIFPRSCKRCGKIIERPTHRQVYCSNSCSAKANWDNPWLKAEMLLKHSINHAGWSTRKKGTESFPEKFWRQRLEKEIFTFTQERMVKKKVLGLKRNGNYFLDFFFPELNVNLEVDGRQHDERKESDAIRDEALTRYGVTVIRYRWPRGPNRFQEAHEQTVEFIALLKERGARLGAFA